MTITGNNGLVGYSESFKGHTIPKPPQTNADVVMPKKFKPG